MRCIIPFKSICNYFIGLFKTNKSINFDIDVQEFIPRKEEVELFLPEERIISKFDFKKPTILIIDDSKGIVSIAEDFVSEQINKSDFNIISFWGVHAPFVMKETLIKLKEQGLNCIDYAVIDIVLPGRVKDKEKTVRMDGIDVAIFLNDEFKCQKFMFYSGNILNAYLDFIEEKFNRFKDYFGKSMKNFIVIKTDTEEKTKEKFRKLFNGEFYATKINSR